MYVHRYFISKTTDRQIEAWDIEGEKSFFQFKSAGSLYVELASYYTITEWITAYRWDTAWKEVTEVEYNLRKL